MYFNIILTNVLIHNVIFFTLFNFQKFSWFLIFSNYETRMTAEHLFYCRRILTKYKFLR